MDLFSFSVLQFEQACFTQTQRSYGGITAKLALIVGVPTHRVVLITVEVSQDAVKWMGNERLNLHLQCQQDGQPGKWYMVCA
ncbi:MAG: hypothetical protein FD130_363 [Halothiobacillaceae bacterium]|nr:MAG: hypothetical protein FD130_363 [Halothiobacillaceae bacterium]